MSVNNISTTSLSAHWVQNAEQKQADTELALNSDIKNMVNNTEVHNYLSDKKITNNTKLHNNIKEGIGSKGQKLPDEAQVRNAFSSASGSDSSSALEKALNHINKYIEKIQRDIKFTVDESSGKTVVNVLDSKTDTVIRQMPTEIALKLAENLQKSGSLVSFKV